MAKKINWFPGLKPGMNIGQDILSSLPKTGVFDPGFGMSDPGTAMRPRGGNPYAGILSDYLNQARADFAAESTADRGSMINQLRRYLISYGGSPEFSGMGGLGGEAAGYLGEAMDPRTMELAAKAEKEGLSSHSRMMHANEIAMRRIPSALASRGMLRSGQTGYDLGEQALAHKQAGYDMLNELLSGITGSVSGFQNAERQRQRALADLAMQQAMAAAQDWGDSYFDDYSGLQSALQTPSRSSGFRPVPGIQYKNQKAVRVKNPLLAARAFGGGNY